MKLLNHYIAFYTVDLVCNVVTSIGCGSRSKPILLALENEESIKEVKLNRKGDTLFIHWYKTDITFRLEILESIFSKYDVGIKRINEQKHKKYLNLLFKDSDNWLDAEHIDELSRVEADVVAKQLIAVYKTEASIDLNQETRLKKDIVTIFYDFFLNFENIQQLSDTNIYRKLIIKVLEKSKNYFNSNDAPDINLLLNGIGGHYKNEDQTKYYN